MFIQPQQTQHQRTPSIYFKFDDQSHHTRNLTKSSLMFDYSISNQKHIFMNHIGMNNNKGKNNTGIKDNNNNENGKEEYQCYQINKLTPLGKYIQMKIDQSTGKKIKINAMMKMNTIDINTNNIVNNNNDHISQQQQKQQTSQQHPQNNPHLQTYSTQQQPNPQFFKKLPSHELITKKSSYYNLKQQQIHQDQFFKIYGSKNLLLQQNHNKYSSGKIKTEEFFQEFQENFIITFDQEDQIFVNQWSQNYNKEDVNENNYDGYGQNCNYYQNEFQQKISKISKGNLNFQQFQPEEHMKFIQIQLTSKQNINILQNQPNSHNNPNPNQIISSILNNSFQNININSNITLNNQNLNNNNNITELQKILNDKINFNSNNNHINQKINKNNNEKTTKKHIINPDMLYVLTNQVLSNVKQTNKENINPNIIHNNNQNKKNQKKNNNNKNNNNNINHNIINNNIKMTSSTPDPLQFQQVISFGPIPSSNINKLTKKSKSTSNSNTNIHNPSKKCFITHDFQNNSSQIIQKNPLIDTKRRVPIKNIQSLIIKHSKQREQRCQRTNSQLQTRHHKSNLINCQILTSTVNKSQKPLHCHTSNQNIWSNPINTKKSFSLQNTFNYDNMFKTNGFKETLKSTTLQNWKKKYNKNKEEIKQKKTIAKKKRDVNIFQKLFIRV